MGVLALGLILAGLAAVVVGCCCRCGTAAVCSRCSFELTGVRDPVCPECGRPLDEKRAVARGTRRIGCIRAGVVVALAGMVALAASVTTGSFDRSKPVWLLDAEYGLLGSSREKALFGELERRMLLVETSADEREAIAGFLGRLGGGAPSSEPRLDLLDTGLRTGTLGAAEARALIRGQLAGWPDLSDAQRERLAVYLARWVSMFGATWEEMTPLIEAGRRRAHAMIELERDRSHISTSVMPEGRVLGAWWRSVSAPALDGAMRAELVGDAVAVDIAVRPRVSRGCQRLVATCTVRVRTLLHGSNVAARVTAWRESCRIDGRAPVIPSGLPRSVVATVLLSGGTPVLNIDTGRGVAIGGLAPGEHEIELTYRVVAVIDDGSGAEPWGERSDQPDPLAVFDRVFTETLTFEVVPGEDGSTVRLLEPGSPGVPTASEMLGTIRVPPRLYYLEDDDRPWRFAVGSWRYMRHTERPGRGGRPNAVPVAFRVMAIQGERRWDLGSVVMMSGTARTGTHRLLRAPAGGDGAANLGPPDLSRPVRIVLTPDAASAERTVDVTEIWDGTLDLGLFQLSDDELEAAQLSADALGPPPAFTRR